MPQESAMLPCLLQQRVIGTTEYSSCISKSIHFGCTRRFPHIEILHQPVTLCMQLGDVLVRCTELLLCRFAAAFVILQISLQVSLHASFFFKCLSVRGSLP